MSAPVSTSTGTSTSPLLEITDLHVAYGQVEAVRGVSLSLMPGQIVSVIGPNGAGKTTLLGAVMGLLPSRGGLRFDGEDLADVDVESRVERGLCLVPEKRELFGELTVLDNLMLGAYAKRLSGATLRSRLDAVHGRFPRLAERRRQRADTLSGGERQMLALGRALMSAPRLLMLDEPSLGLAPLVVQEILAIVRGLRRDGVAILLVEQNARAALDSSDLGYVLETGEVALSGASSALASDPRVQATYL
ncbi:ABC transporter ATP-binding protein, partial [Aquabacterium sp.]|uniref:ABC transporter ATP-binding protein n=1 Tax=Aquabacterium sp. TaxID=1872578 RepID=UPI002CB16A25